jgi:hypothetical protein
MMNVIMLCVANKPFMLSVFMLNVVILSVIMLNVVASPKKVVRDIAKCPPKCQPA